MFEMNYTEKFSQAIKLFKFYDLSTAQVIETTATTERQARKNLGKQPLIFIARIRLSFAKLGRI